MKKLFALLTVLGMVFFASCGGNKTEVVEEEVVKEEVVIEVEVLDDVVEEVEVEVEGVE